MKRQAFDQRVPVALGGGLAAALLLVGLRQGTLPGLLLASLSPLPLMIATLGFGKATGLGAVGIAVFTFMALEVTAAAPEIGWPDALLTAGVEGLVFTLSQALPAWWLAHLAGLNRAETGLRWSARASDRARAKEWYPVGLVVLNAALISFAVIALATLIVSLSQTNFEASLDRAAATIAPLISQALGSYELPKGIDVAKLSRFVIRATPPFAASLMFVMLLLNFWIASRVVQVSNLLPRPWPDIAHELRVPRLLGVGLAISCALCLLGGIAGLVASIASAVLVIVFALQGLCVIHDLSRGSKFRGALLCGLYIAFAVLIAWPLVVFTLVGLFEAGFSLRDRKTAAAPHD